MAGKGTGRSVRWSREGGEAVETRASGEATRWRDDAPGVLLCAVNLRLVRLAGGVHVPDVERRARGSQVTAGATLANLSLGHGGIEGMRACVWPKARSLPATSSYTFSEPPVRALIIGGIDRRLSDLRPYLQRFFNFSLFSRSSPRTNALPCVSLLARATPKRL